MALIKYESDIYIRSDGTVLPSNDTWKLYPNSKGTNLLNIYLEDGNSEGLLTQVQYVLNGKYLTEWLPLFQKGQVTKDVDGVAVVFNKAQHTVPVNVTQNASKTQTIPIGVQIRVLSDETYQGMFDTLADLNAGVLPTETLADEEAYAYVLDGEVFYQCQEVEGNYEWVAVDIDTEVYVEAKSYTTQQLQLQKGHVSNKTTITLQESIQNAVFLELQSINELIVDLTTRVAQNEVDILAIKNGMEQDVQDLIGANMIKTLDYNDTTGIWTVTYYDDTTTSINANGQILQDIDDLDVRVTQNETDIASNDADILALQGRVTQNENDIDANETAIGNNELDIADNLVKITALETANMFKDVTYNVSNGVLQFTLFDDTTKSVDLPLELIVESGYYNETTNELVLVLANGNEIKIPVGNLLTDLDAINIRYSNGDSTLVAVNVKSAIDELDGKAQQNASDISYLDADKIDKDFTPYPELTTDLSDDDYVIVRDVSNNQTKKTKVSTLRQFETDTYEYGVRWVEGQSSSAVERVKIVNGEMTVGSATNLVANVGIDNQVVENSFDNINIFIRNRVVIDGNTMVRVNKYYIREYSVNDGGTVYNYILMCEKKLTGYRLPIRFDNGDGTEKDYAYLPAYEGYVDENGVGRSISGVLPTTSISRNNSRIACRKNDGDGTNTDSLWGQVDLAEYYDLVQVPIWIEFANFNTQAGIGRGVVDLGFDEDTVADSTVANTAIIANNSNFDVGMTIYLSTGTYHQITQIDIDTPIAGQTTLTFNGETVTTLTGVNIDPRQYYTGMTDSVVASTGFYKANDGKHPFKWRGMENVWGNIWKFVDGVKISNWYAWVSTEPEHYDDVSSDVDGNYGSNWTKLSYQNSLSNGYISKLGYDDRFPFARLPIEVGGGSSTYYADYHYQNSGDRTLLVGGYWSDSSYAGLTFWSAHHTLGAADVHIGFRLSYRP